MPKIEEFVAAFGLIKGNIFSDYRLNTVRGSEEAVKRYHEYKFNITLIFEPLNKNAQYNDLYDALANRLEIEHIVYGIKNPYRSIIDLPKYGDIYENPAGEIIFKLTGHAYRKY